MYAKDNVSKGFKTFIMRATFAAALFATMLPSAANASSRSTAY